MVAVSIPPPHARKRTVQTPFEDLNTHMPNATREAREILGLPPLSRSSSAGTLTDGSEDNGPETPERPSNPLPVLDPSSQCEKKEDKTPIAPPIFEAQPAEPIAKRASFTFSPSSPATPDTRSSRIYTAPIVVGRGQSTDNLLGPPPKRKPVGRWNKAKKAVTKVFTDPLGVHEWAHTGKRLPHRARKARADRFEYSTMSEEMKATRRVGKRARIWSSITFGIYRTPSSLRPSATSSSRRS
jgi:hypothetical protein